MHFSALTCPQCAAPLPRQASWRMVTCTFCGAVVTRSKSVVEAAKFREAYARAQAHAMATGASASRVLRLNGQRYRVLTRLGTGERTEVYLAERISPLPQRVTLKLAHSATKPGSLADEAKILEQLQSIKSPGAEYFTQRLPQPMRAGVFKEAAGPEREALILRYPCGYWGSLADVLRFAPAGIDPRHGVWIWRRILEVLAFVHESGWSHGDLAPEHFLVNSRDHGVLIIGWAKARAVTDTHSIARDLMQSAWSVRALLSGGKGAPRFSSRIPAPFADLLLRCSEDASWSASTGARGLERALHAAAHEAFGPPKFIPFNPTTA